MAIITYVVTAVGLIMKEQKSGEEMALNKRLKSMPAAIVADAPLKRNAFTGTMRKNIITKTKS